MLSNYFMPDTFPVTFHGFSKSHGAIALILQIQKRGSQRLRDLSRILLEVAEAGLQYKAVFFWTSVLCSTFSCLAQADGSSGPGMTDCSGFSRKQGFLERGTFSAELEKVLGNPEGVGRFICSISYGDWIVSKAILLYWNLLIPAILSALVRPLLRSGR